MKTLWCSLSLALALFAAGCGNAQQQAAYEHVLKLEQQLSSENAPVIVAEYQKVIRMRPGSDWAKKAQARIDAIGAAQKADELHKSVFHETGID